MAFPSMSICALIMASKLNIFCDKLSELKDKYWTQIFAECRTIRNVTSRNKSGFLKTTTTNLYRQSSMIWISWKWFTVKNWLTWDQTALVIQITSDKTYLLFEIMDTLLDDVLITMTWISYWGLFELATTRSGYFFYKCHNTNNAFWMF